MGVYSSRLRDEEERDEMGKFSKVLVGVAVAAGLTLVGSPAFAHGGGHGHSETVVCHKPGTPAEKTLTIDEKALDGHLGHGDTLGECAPVVEPTPEPTPEPEEPQVPDQPASYVEYGEWGDWVADCEAGTETRGRWTWTVDFEWDGAEWAPVLGPDVADTETRDASAEVCPVDEPEQPVEEPGDPVDETPGEETPGDDVSGDEDPADETPVETPVEETPAAPVTPAQPAQHYEVQAATDDTQSLAQTGAEANPWLVGGAVVLLAAGGLLTVARRRA